MTLTLYYHPLSSFCWKALVALYELDIPFTPYLVDLSDEKIRNEYLKIAPMGQFPVLQDDKNKKFIPQSACVIDYLDRNYPGPVTLIPSDPDQALEVRVWNEFIDDYIHRPMQKIGGDFRRPEGQKDPYGVEEARNRVKTAYDVLEKRLEYRTWMVEDSFSLADCSACAALYYTNKVQPVEARHVNLNKYLERLIARPSFARVLKEAEPYFHLFTSKG